MGETVIRVENLSKKYLISHKQQGGYTALRDVIAQGTKNAAKRMLSPFGKSHAESSEEFFALKDVSFEIKEGDKVGIIGRNGAGKSTLLKILSRITEPSRGRVEISGRVASLLEVGTGFHPELTGRENIFLNGAILGMSRHEIKRKFDEIVDFAEVEKFLDTPVKRFSSGMYVRLAFSVAAHLEPEILVVDEVLAVGDAEFQKKCLGKMGEVSKEGRTVLFVSHNMAAVQQLCGKGIVLNSGQVDFDGPILSAVEKYMGNAKKLVSSPLDQRRDRKGTQWLKFTKVEVCSHDGHEVAHALSGQDISIRFHYVSNREIPRAVVNVAFNVRSDQGYLLTNLNSVDVGHESLAIYHRGFFQCSWPKLSLRAGVYDCALLCSVNGEIVDWLQDAFSLSVEDGDFYNTGKIVARSQGDVLSQYSWKGFPTLT